MGEGMPRKDKCVSGRKEVKKIVNAFENENK